MQSFTFLVFGNPVSQPRQRHCVLGGFSHNYTPSKSPVNEYKAGIRMAVGDKYHGALLSGAVRVNCEFVFERPKGHFRTGKHSNMLRENAPYWHTKKPDRDNCDKAVLDALKGVLLADDACVCSGALTKRYAYLGEQPHTEITVTEL
jgi:Holliday junction resolvase RusA-like endonuclease